MAEVWRGHDDRLDQPVAVKLLDERVGGAAAGERFAREARAAAQILHPNVVTVLDVGQHGGRRFLVMELLSGRSLDVELAERGRFGVAETCSLLSQAAAGLAAAHRAGVVHRDVKPANLHLTGRGVLKVVDFGLAHVASDAARLTAVGTLVGTAAYMAPEQIEGQGGEAAADLYALGCVCYELLCGQPPFGGAAPELMRQHLHQQPVPPGQHRPEIPAELERLVLAMLAKSPAERPATAEVVQQALARLAQSAARPGERHPSPPVGQARPGGTALFEAPTGGPPPAPQPGPQPGPQRGAQSGPQPGPWSVSSEGRRLLVQVAITLGVLVLVAWGAVALFADTGEPSAASQSVAPRPSRSPVEQPVSATPAATPTLRARASATPSRAPSPRAISGVRQAWLADFDRAVLAQQAQGGIDPGLAREAHEKIREAGRKLLEGDDREAQKKIQELGRELAKAQRKGELAADGPLAAFLSRSGLTAGDGGGDGGDGDGRDNDYDRDRDNKDEDD